MDHCDFTQSLGMQVKDNVHISTKILHNFIGNQILSFIFLKHKIISEEQKEKNVQNEFIMHEIYAKVNSHVRQLSRRAGMS